MREMSGRRRVAAAVLVLGCAVAAAGDEPKPPKAAPPESKGVAAYREAIRAFVAYAEANEKKLPADVATERLRKASDALQRATQAELTDAEKRTSGEKLADDLAAAALRSLAAESRRRMEDTDRGWKNAVPEDRELPPRDPKTITAKMPVADLTNLLQSPDKLTRGLAADALAELGPKAAPAQAALVKLTRDDDYFVARAAEKALVRIGTPKAMKEVVFKLDRYYDELVRMRAAEDLAEFGPLAKAAIPDLIRCFDTPNKTGRVDGVAYAAAETLATLGPEARAALGKQLRSDDPYHVRCGCFALERMGAAAADELPRLRAQMKHADVQVQEDAERAVRRISLSLGGMACRTLARAGDRAARLVESASGR